jgi:hypothetical protein
MASIHDAIQMAGGQVEFAAALSVSKSTVYGWMGRGGVPISKALEVEFRYGIPAMDIVDYKGELMRLAVERVKSEDARIAADNGCGSLVIVQHLRSAGWEPEFGTPTDAQFEQALRRSVFLRRFMWNGQEIGL